MFNKWLTRLLLTPFALLYGLGVSLRNFFYRVGLLRSVTFNLPVISVGNLSVGGAGKTPHIEYLIRLLREHLHIATLSRGYGRKTKGYRVVQMNNSAEQVGDEPLQFKRKYPDVYVTVAESRAFGVPQIVGDRPETQLVLLDDAFQHRAVTPGLNILLTEYSHPFPEDFLMPVGRLREWRSAYQRADTIIVTKCPDELPASERDRLRELIQPQPHQQLFFSYYGYQSPYFFFNADYRTHFQDDWEVLLICAIARSDYLVDYLESRVGAVHKMVFEDHHYFSKYDMGQLKKRYDLIESSKKLIITTEKDAMRLELHRPYLAEQKLPIFVLPVGVQFHDNDGPAFDQSVKDFLLNFRV